MVVGAGEEVVGIGGPLPEAELGGVAAGALEAQPGEWGLGRRASAGGAHGAVDAGALVLGHVPPHGAVEHHAHDAGLRVGEHRLEPRARWRGVDAGRLALRRRHGSAQHLDALALLGPHERLEAQALVGVGHVERRQVAAAPLGDTHRRVEVGRRATPLGRELERRGRRAPAVVAQPVAIAVPQQVQPGARADLEQPQRQAGVVRDPQEAAQQRRAAAYLIGLHLRPQPRPDRGLVRVERGEQRAPGALRLERAAGRGVERGELRGAPAEHEPVHRAEQP